MSGTTDLTAEEANEQIALQAGRKAPYTMVGDWVALAVSAKLIDREALALYTVMAGHVNTQRAAAGDRDVWPSRGTLADLLDYKQARAVDKYLLQLENIGAVDAERGELGAGSSGYRRNRYTVHQTPPEGYQGPRTYVEWYEARKAAKASAAGQQVVRPSAPRPRSASQRTTGVVRASAPGVVRPSAPPVVRPSAHELDVVQPAEVNEGGLTREQAETALSAVLAEAPPPAAAPPPRPLTPEGKPELEDPSTWHCPEHLAMVEQDPGVDIPKCGRCGRVASAMRRRQRAAEEATVAELARLEREAKACSMCIADGTRPDGTIAWVRLTPGTRAAIAPRTACDHSTPTELVMEELGEASVAVAQPGPAPLPRGRSRLAVAAEAAGVELRLPPVKPQPTRSPRGLAGRRGQQRAG